MRRLFFEGFHFSVFSVSQKSQPAPDITSSCLASMSRRLACPQEQTAGGLRRVVPPVYSFSATTSGARAPLGFIWRAYSAARIRSDPPRVGGLPCLESETSPDRPPFAYALHLLAVSNQGYRATLPQPANMVCVRATKSARVAHVSTGFTRREPRRQPSYVACQQPQRLYSPRRPFCARRPLGDTPGGARTSRHFPAGPLGARSSARLQPFCGLSDFQHPRESGIAGAGMATKSNLGESSVVPLLSGEFGQCPGCTLFSQHGGNYHHSTANNINAILPS